MGSTEELKLSELFLLPAAMSAYKEVRNFKIIEAKLKMNHLLRI